jgi:hypothetical protein
MKKQFSLKQFGIKKYMLIASYGILFNSCTTTYENRNLEKFDKVNLTGNIELNLKKNSNNTIEIKTHGGANIAYLITEVRNGELYIHNEKEVDINGPIKYTVYLNHSGISDLTLSGVVTLKSDDIISQNDLMIKGDGILNGNLEVSVDNLNVDLDGMSNMNISGNSDTSNIRISGIGMINISSLKTNRGKNVSEGLAIIRK